MKIRNNLFSFLVVQKQIFARNLSPYLGLKNANPKNMKHYAQVPKWMLEEMRIDVNLFEEGRLLGQFDLCGSPRVPVLAKKKPVGQKLFLSPPLPPISMLNRYSYLECNSPCKIKACSCFFDLGAHFFNIEIGGAGGAAEKTGFCPTGFFFRKYRSQMLFGNDFSRRGILRCLAQAIYLCKSVAV